MKIIRKPIIAASAQLSPVAIPEPFDKFYELMSDEEFEEEFDYPAHPSPCEETEGYDIEFISYVKAKPEFQEELQNDGLDVVELVKEGDDTFLGYVVHDQIYNVDLSELPDTTSYEEYRDAGYLDDFEDIEECTNVSAAVDTGLDYWYFTRHGLGPGMMPQGVQIVDWYEEGYKTWIKLDKLLTTKELDYYDIQEQWPPEGAITHNGDEIVACDMIQSSEDIEAKGRTERLQKASERLPFGEGKRNASVFYKGFKIAMNAVDKLWDILDRANRIVEEGFETKDDAISYIQDAGLVAASTNIESSKCNKVAEDNDTIEYVVSSEDIEGMSLARYRNYKIMSNPHVGGWDVFTSNNDLLKQGFATEAAAREYIDGLTTVVRGGEEVGEVQEEEEDFLEQPEQEFSSAETAINGKQGKLPAVFSKANIPNGALVLDYGGGTVESEQVAQAYLDQFNATEMLYDPYNQTADHNREVISTLRQNGGADVAVCSNVLNVIKEEDVRIDLLNKIKKLLKNGATAYISVYEGSGKGEGSATQKGKSFQNNRKLSGYLEEVQSVFPNATRKGAVIIAPNTEAVAATTQVNEAIKLDDIDLDALKEEIVEGCEAYLTGPMGGFLPSGTEKEDRWDMTADEIYNVYVDREDDPYYGDRIKIEVRAELDYEGMSNLAEELDPIVANYDEDAYFDQEVPGIMQAYLTGGADIAGSTDIQADWNEKMLDKHDRDFENLDYEYGEEVEKDSIEDQFEFDLVVEVEPDTSWSIAEGDPFYHADTFVLEDTGLSKDDLLEIFEDLLTWHIPSKEGKYSLKGVMKLVFDYDANREKYSLDAQTSGVSDLQTAPAGKVESSTRIEATMSEEDLDRAILEGKPFDLESFRKYKSQIDPDAILAKDVEVGDIISVDEDASEVDLGTVVKILSINDPKESWIEYSFKCEIVDLPRDSYQSVTVGSIIDLHFDGDEAIGHIVPV